MHLSDEIQKQITQEVVMLTQEVLLCLSQEKHSTHNENKSSSTA